METTSVNAFGDNHLNGALFRKRGGLALSEEKRWAERKRAAGGRSRQFG
jgi:hypothetical protein